jgi:phosphatidate cytidylyltransferase
MILQSTVSKRIFFGLLMIVSLAVLFAVEGWLASRNYYLPVENLQGIVFAIAVALVGCGGAVEMVSLTANKGYKPCLWVILPSICAIILQPFWSIYTGETASMAGVMMMSLLLAALVQGVKNGTAHTLANLGVSSLIVIYVGTGCYFLVRLRLLGAGSEGVCGQIGAVVLFLASVKSADIGAYFTGRFFGRHKWVPLISPAKTWEGFFGGVVLAIITASLLADVFGIMRYGRAILFGIIVALTGQLGDLLESMFKRDGGIKDSARLVPEFGGFLDIIDSPLAAGVFAYALLVWG